MSDNVISFRKVEKTKSSKKIVNVEGLVSAIVDWAEEQGVDVQNDVGFQIRCADFMTYLELVAKEENETRKKA